jgi:eukaryotic-like serine/threonine-protein kinase
METAGNNDDPLTASVSTMDDGLGNSSFNKTIPDGPGSTCEDSANDWKRWVNVESTIDEGSPDADWQCEAIELALDGFGDDTHGKNEGERDPDGTFLWGPEETWAPVLQSTVWPLGSSLLTSSIGRRASVAGFDILSELGHGGMGIVYKARDLSLKRLVALKVIRHDRHRNPEDLARLDIEAEVLARLNHPNILRIYEIGKVNGVPFVALELLTGGSLKERLAGTPQPVRESATLISTLARAVHAAHTAGILHRDIKPSNVLFDGEGVPKIADFGLAKRLDVEDGETVTGQVIGTPSYMAPEQAQGWTPEIGRAADVYSLGAILYEMLTGRPPFKGTSQAETLKLVLEEDPISPSRLRTKVPFDLETICLKCIARDPRMRYGDALSLADDLDRFLAGHPIRARRTPLLVRAIKLSKRHPVITVVLAMVLLAAASGLIAAVHAQSLENARIERVEQADQQIVFDAHRALAEKRWKDAESLASQVMNDLKSDSDGRLTKLRQIAESLKVQAIDGLAAQDAAELARRQLIQFGVDRDEALFRDTRYGGLSPANSLEETCRYARHGLGIFGVGATGDQWALRPLPPSLTDDERRDVADGFYELLLILSDAVSSLPGADQAGRAEQALRIVDRAPGVRSRATRAYHLHRSTYLDSTGDPDGAALEREAADQLPPADVFDYYLIGRELAGNGDWKGAIPNLLTVTRQRPNHFWANCWLAICYLQTSEPVRAIHCLDDCLRQQPERVWLYLLRGMANAEEGRIANAVAEREGDPAPAVSSFASNHFERAEDDYRTALALLGDSSSDADLHCVLLNNRGHIRLEQQKYDAAAADFEAAIRLSDHRVEPVRGLAHVYQRQGKTDDALKQLAIAIKLDPKIAGPRRARADILLGLGESSPDLRDVDFVKFEDHIRSLSPDQRDAVHRDLEEAIRLESPGRNWIAYDKTKLAALFHVAGSHAAAIEACSAALEIAPALAFAHQLRINVLLALKQHDDLIRSCDIALDAVKPSAELYELRGMVKDGLEDYSGAIADYTQSLSLHGEKARLLRRRGWSYLAHDAIGPALDDFDETIRLEPSNADAYVGRGLAKVRLGNHEDAVSNAKRALLLDEKSWRIAYNAACVYAQAAVAADVESRKNGPVAVRVVNRYLERAVDLARLALDRAAVEQQSVIARETIRTAPALLPIKGRLKSLEGVKARPE